MPSSFVPSSVLGTTIEPSEMTLGTNVGAFLTTPSGANLASALTSALPSSKGGTGIANNAASTITISGNYGLTLTLSGASSLSLPTSGTVATLTGYESFTNKSISSSSLILNSSSNPSAGGIWYSTLVGISGYIASGVPIGLLAAMHTARGSSSLIATGSFSYTNVPSGASATLPANSLTVGKILRVTQKGYFNTGATAGTAKCELLINGMNVSGSASPVTMTNSVTSGSWEMECEMFVASTGMSANVYVSGFFKMVSASGTTVIYPMANSSLSTVDTTTSRSVDTRFTFSATGGNAPSFTLTSHTIQLTHSGY